MTDAAPARIAATGLTRHFAARTAVRDLSLSIAAGEVVVLLGPNGAGKTTTLRMLAGLIAPSSGSVSIGGVSLTPDNADDLRGSVGLLTEAPGVWDRLSLTQNLLTYARLYGVGDPHGAVARVLAVVGLSGRARDVAGVLSKGLRQRLALARTLLHEPAILLLDEPTSGLDPASARDVRALITDLRRDGRALLVSTHNLAEAEALADRIAVLKTSLLVCERPAALRRLSRGFRVAIDVEHDASRWVPTVASLSVADVRVDGTTLTVTLDREELTPDLVAALVANGARIRRVVPVERSLEEVYLSLVGAEVSA